MKKIFINIALMLFFVTIAKAQQTTVQAIINADGSRSMNITNEAGEATKISAADNASLQAKYLEVMKQQSVKKMQTATMQKSQLISHRAILGTNGKQQMILTFASGKEIAIDAVDGQTIQETYLAYLKKEGLPCACSSTSTDTDSKVVTKTATRNASIEIQ